MGDFNSVPNSGLYTYIQNSSLSLRNLHNEAISGQFNMLISNKVDLFKLDINLISNKCNNDFIDCKYIDKSIDNRSWFMELIHTDLVFIKLDDKKDVYRIGLSYDKSYKSNITLKEQTITSEVKFKSAYYDLFGSHPLYTSISGSKIGCVDYIFYEFDSYLNGIKPVSLYMNIPPIDDVKKRIYDNCIYPSDHFPLGIEFELSI